MKDIFDSGGLSGNRNFEEAAQRYFSLSGEEELEKLLRAGYGLICYFSTVFCGIRPNDDIIQVGYEGLLKAVKGFRPEYGNRFTTYAGHCIIGAIKHHLRKENSFYRPCCLATLQEKAEMLLDMELEEKEAVPSPKYLSEKLNVTEEGLREVMRAGLVSLDKLDLSKISSLRYESFRFPIEDRILLEQALKTLNDLQRKVIYLLFYRDMSQQQAADVLGLHQRKVSRVMHQGLADLRKAW